ncbi:MAG: NAD(P)H-hydrate dehydratase [Nitrospirae bacterium]|nr:NAD(P)H-hydrate dehydratase [Nitrospirota bacterium]
MEIVTAAEMQAIDAATINGLGVPGLVLMEQAGTLTARAIVRHFGPPAGRRVVVLCGKGNNGGDGFVIARHLLNAGAAVTCHLAGGADGVQGDALANLRAFAGLGGTLIAADAGHTLAHDLATADLVVDALFGTGLNQPLRAPAADWVNLLHQAHRPTVAVDIPSGVHADSGEVLGTAVRADLTVTFCRPKRGHFMGPGADLRGRLVVADIGIPDRAVADAEVAPRLIRPDQARAWLPQRAGSGHKGTYGHTLIVGGSPGMTGAPTLAALGALRVGSGLVTAAVPEGLNDILEQKLTEAMTLPVADTPDRTLAPEAVAQLVRAAAERSVTVLGPGLSGHPDAARAARAFTLQCEGPLVIDADGLNAWAGHMDAFPRRPLPTVVTPHPGEMARLTGKPTAQVQHDRIGTACRFAHEHEVTVVLKGAHTVVADPFGQVWVNPTGNPALASGGTGDVLAGVIGGLLAQGRPAAEAAALGVFLHGLAADIWADRHGRAGLAAGDLAALLPEAMARLAAGAATIPVDTIGPLG